MKWMLIIVCVFFWQNTLYAEEIITSIEVQGTGANQSEAVQNGLIEALKQTKGVTINSQKMFEKKFHETGYSTGDLNSYNLKIDEHSQSKIREITQGLIHEYRIIETNSSDRGKYLVKLAVKLVRYKTPGITPDSRRKIAILPFRASSLSYLFHYGSVPASVISRIFTQKMVSEITQTRRFTVLDREYMEEFLSEKNMILSGDAPVSEQMKVGQVLGVDYLLVGTITNVEQKQTPYEIQVTGESGLDYSASFAADYRIIVMATRQIKWSDSVVLTLEHEDIEQMAPSFDPNEIQQKMLTKAAKQIIHKAMENIYPIKVTEIQQNGDIVLNQGGVTVKQGDVFDVYRLGEKIVDPYTKESLGSSELWIASIEISRVIPKMSYGKIIKGDSSLIKKGQICRRQLNENNLELPGTSGRKSDIQSTTGGGVVLPFD